MRRRFDQAGIVALSLLALLCTFSALALPAPKRDHLTELEAERVREAQILDKRMEVFIRAAERRLLVLTDPRAASNKQVQKEMEKWGELPQGTRAELLTDLSSILDEAITNIDDVAARNEKNPLLSKALRKLADAATRFQVQLSAMRAQAREGSAEREAIEQALAHAAEIIEAARKLPPPPAKK
ncbi:MAG TPA: hypothetical protein VF723_11855 [Pyrinomonadaceae bacterium]|jgi:hypothetical protein